MDQHALTHDKLAVGEEGIVGGKEHLRDGGSLLKAHTLGDRHRHAFVGRHARRVTATAKETEHALPLFHGGNTLSNADDHASHLQAGDVLGYASRNGVVAASLRQVCPVQRGCLHIYQHLVGPGNRIWSLHNLEYLRASRLCHYGGSHSPSPVSASYCVCGNTIPDGGRARGI